MSASKTNLEKQKRRHVGPLVGITLALLVAAGLIFGYLAYTGDTDETPPPQAQTDEPSTRPATGAPATPMNDPEMSPRIVEPAPTPEPVD